jgi:hypothetical protein
MMSREAFGRRQSSVALITGRNNENVTLIGNQAGTRTKYLPNTKPECYQNTGLLGKRET